MPDDTPEIDYTADTYTELETVTVTAPKIEPLIMIIGGLLIAYSLLSD